eukprot:464442-Prymnesium_polylepis.1
MPMLDGGGDSLARRVRERESLQQRACLPGSSELSREQPAGASALKSTRSACGFSHLTRCCLFGKCRSCPHVSRRAIHILSVSICERASLGTSDSLE